MNKYAIARASGAVDLDGRVDGTAWSRAAVMPIDLFPWHKAGLKQATSLRALYDDRALYLQFTCEDKHISSQVTELNGPVCSDSCVEFFATIEPDRRQDYFNFEANCCGHFHLGFGAGRDGRKLISPQGASRIEVATSVAGPTKSEAVDDDGWWLVAAIGFDVLGELAGAAVRPQSGTTWRANAYRCGGATDPQFACWNPVGTDGPDFHRPEFFGEARFA